MNGAVAGGVVNWVTTNSDSVAIASPHTLLMRYWFVAKNILHSPIPAVGRTNYTVRGAIFIVFASVLNQTCGWGSMVLLLCGSRCVMSVVFFLMGYIGYFCYSLVLWKVKLRIVILMYWCVWMLLIQLFFNYFPLIGMCEWWKKSYYY